MLATLVTLLLSLTPECAPGLVHTPPFCVAPESDQNGARDVVVIPESGYGPAVDRWRPWVEIYFRPEDVLHALRIIACESGGDPAARGGVGEMGLFQHHPRYWSERSARYGWGDWSAWSPDANVAVAAAIIYYDDRSWRHWTCR